MTGQNPLRSEVEACLSGIPRAFLRVGRGEWLYVSDAPRHIPCGAEYALALIQAGFLYETQGGLLYIAPEKRWISQVTSWLPSFTDDELLRLYGRQLGGNISDIEYRLWIEGMKQFELGGDRRRWALYDKRVRQTAAVCMRTGDGGGALYHLRVIFLSVQSGKEWNEDGI